MEHKGYLNWELKELTQDENFFYIEGFASTSDRDLGDDIVESGAVLESYKEFGVPKFCNQHDIKGMPLGIIESMSDIGGKPLIKTKMPKSVSLCNDVAELAKMGAYGGLSIGYQIIDAEMDGDIRRIKKLHVFEISLVTLPMNPKAVITSVKTVDIEGFKTLKEIESFIKDLGVSNKEAKTLISKIKCCGGSDPRDDEDCDSARDELEAKSISEFNSMLEEFKQLIKE